MSSGPAQYDPLVNVRGRVRQPVRARAGRGVGELGWRLETLGVELAARVDALEILRAQPLVREIRAHGPFPALYGAANGNNAYFVRAGLVAEVPRPRLADPYVRPKFRESRDERGRLTYRTREEHVRAISQLPVGDLERGAWLPLGAALGVYR